MALLVNSFPGTGKTTLTNNKKYIDQGYRFLDKHPSPFKIKGNINVGFKRNPDFAEDYVRSIKKDLEDHAEDNKFVVLAHSANTVYDVILKHGLKISTVLPVWQCYDEYMQRYRDRGDPPEFIETMDENWRHWQCYYNYKSVEDKRNKFYYLTAGQYLSDVFDDIIKEQGSRE